MEIHRFAFQTLQEFDLVNLVHKQEPEVKVWTFRLALRKKFMIRWKIFVDLDKPAIAPAKIASDKKIWVIIFVCELNTLKLRVKLNVLIWFSGPVTWKLVDNKTELMSLKAIQFIFENSQIVNGFSLTLSRPLSLTIWSMNQKLIMERRSSLSAEEEKAQVRGSMKQLSLI